MNPVFKYVNYSIIVISKNFPFKTKEGGLWETNFSRGQLKCDGTRTETKFHLSAKRTSPSKPHGGGISSFDCWQPRCRASAIVMLDTPCSEVVWRVLATHSIRQFPPFTSPPVRRRVPSHFNWSLLSKLSLRSVPTPFLYHRHFASVPALRT